MVAFVVSRIMFGKIIKYKYFILLFSIYFSILKKHQGNIEKAMTSGFIVTIIFIVNGKKFSVANTIRTFSLEYFLNTANLKSPSKPVV
jgi:hypothetical protein